MRVVLDAGHGGHDKGAIGFTEVFEKDLNLLYASIIAGHLTGFDIKVDMTRYTDEFLELQERCDIANDLKADAFISIHCNSWKTEQPHGWEIFTSKGVTGADSLALCIYDKMLTANMDSRGIKEANFDVLTGTKMPAVLIELGFLSNAGDLAYLLSPRHQVFLSNVIALGVSTWRN